MRNYIPKLRVGSSNLLSRSYIKYHYICSPLLFRHQEKKVQTLIEGIMV